MLAICKYVSFSSKYSINKIHKKRKIDRRRGRTCNLLIRSQAPFHWASRPYCVLRALIDHIDYTQTYACRSIIINAHPPTGMALVQNRLDPARLHHPPSPSAVSIILASSPPPYQPFFCQSSPSSLFTRHWISWDLCFWPFFFLHLSPIPDNSRSDPCSRARAIGGH